MSLGSNESPTLLRGYEGSDGSRRKGTFREFTSAAYQTAGSSSRAIPKNAESEPLAHAHRRLRRGIGLEATTVRVKNRCQE
eukprot:1624650-Rhodomonas_salina.1